jgi:hypothetical protein
VGSEQCDGSNLGGFTCEDLGYVGGTLECSASCTYDFSGCTTGGGPGATDLTTTLLLILAAIVLIGVVIYIVRRK